jgi:hypothetical protein
MQKEEGNTIGGGIFEFNREHFFMTLERLD